MQRLDGPTVSNESLRQPIEQFRINGFFTEQSEVVSRGHDAATEVPSPDAVHDDSTGQRMPGTGDPRRQFRATASTIDKQWHVGTAHDSWNVPRNNFTQSQWVPANVDCNVGNLVF